ncbi:hypothetical protein [Empedobacter falsenii]|uniref:Fam-a protein n=1 Tax=Empedobacter falsenii TaxID=343874 RepID=A0AAW7DCX6_9FLAO|nr:hypothetical protein [Empedobacter falsenii]MDM1549791.1 hypothetical protein [Empedobacter falsenii]
MKHIIYTIIFFMQTIAYGQGGVGINTESPERSLDVNGNMRVTDFQNKTNDDNFKEILISNNNGDIDKQSKSSIFQSTEQQVEQQRAIYYSNNGGDITKEARCGKYSFAIDNNNIALIRLLINPNKNINVNFGLRRLERRVKLIGGHSANSGNGDYYYTNESRAFTIENWNVYQPIFNYPSEYNSITSPEMLDITNSTYTTTDFNNNNNSRNDKRGPAHMINNDFLKLHIVDSETGDLYKIHITRMLNNTNDKSEPLYGINLSNSGIRVITCERYYKQTK